MNQSIERTLDERVLVLAPTAADAALSRTILTEAGFACLVCSDLCGLGREFEQGAGAMLLTEEVLADIDSHCLVETLRQQPKWSDVPILLLTGEGADSPVAVWAMEMLGNVTLLERPVRVTILVSALRTALKARRRQYELRNQVEALRESEERFRLMADSIPQLAWMARPDGHIYWYNRRWYAYTGTTLEQMEGWGWRSVPDPEVLPQVMEHWKSSIATGEPFDMVFSLKGKDGVFRPFLTRVMPVRDDEGRVARWFGTSTDISEQKRAEEELRDARSRLESTLAAGEVGTWEFDVANNVVRADHNFARMFGVTPDVAAGGPLEAYMKAIQPDDRDRVAEAIRRVLEAGETYEAEYRLAGPLGGVRWVVARGRVERDEAGRAVWLPGVAVDITGQRQAEERERRLLAEAAAANAKFRAFFEQGALFAGIMDVNGTIIEANRLSWEGCGYAREQVIGRPFWEGPWWTPSAALVERIKAASAQAAAGQTFRAEMPYFLADGSERMADVIILPIKDEAGRVMFLAPTGTDITDRKRAEQQVRDSEEQFRTLVNNSPDLIVRLDPDLRHTFVSPAIERLAGFRPEEMLGKTGLEIGLGEDMCRQFGEKCHEAARTRQPVTFEFTDDRTGSLKYLVSKIVPEAAPDGVVSSFLIMTADITERKQIEQSLRDSEERYRATVEHAAVGVCNCTPDGRFVYANRTFCEIVGYGLEDLKQKTWQELTPPDDREADLALGQRVRAGEMSSYTMEKRYICKDGSMVWVSLSGSFVRDAEGRVRLGIGVIVDISDRKRVEEALREAERRWRSLTEALPNLVWTDLPDGQCDYLSSQWGTYTGIPENELLGLRWLEAVIHPDDRERTLACWRAACADKGDYDLEYRIRRHDGVYHWFKTRGVPIRDEQGKIVYWLGTCTDIEDNKRLEEEFRRQQNLLTMAEIAASIGHFEWDISDEDSRWSPEMEALYGLAPGGYEGGNAGWRKLVDPSDLARVEEEVRESLTTGRLQTEFRAVWPNGTVRWLEARAVVSRNGDGKPVRMVGINMDVTDRKQAEEALRDADRRKDEFLATLAHELRNPLAPLRNGLHLMKLAKGDSEAVEQTRAMMERQLRQMMRLIDDLLDVSRIRRGKVELRKQRVELGVAVNNAVETSRPMIEGSGHDLTITVPPDPIYVDADLIRLAQVFTNLLNNAAKYTEKGGHVTLTVDRQGSDAVVRVRDTGVGIPHHMLPKIFEMYTQVDGSLEKSQGGLGIGLSLVKGLVQMHGGSVEARSEGPGRGSEFVVRLPVVLSSIRRKRDDNGGEVVRNGARHRILIADDNRESAISLAKLLEIMGNDTQTAYDGLEALDVAAAFRPDIVMLDIGMPKLNGYDTARRIREQAWGSNIVLVALTGCGQDEDRRKSQEAGFNLHMVKPVDPQALEKLLAGMQGTRA